MASHTHRRLGGRAARSSTEQKKLLPPLQIDVICEGATEEKYFGTLLNILYGDNLRLRFHQADGAQIQKLVVKAKQVEEQPGTRHRAVWIICDRDENTSKGFDSVKKWLTQPKRSCRRRLALSHPCIEFWFLLYFFDHPTHRNSRSDYVNDLVAEVPNFSKARRREIPQALLTPAGTSLASRRAQSLLPSEIVNIPNLMDLYNHIWNTTHRTGIPFLFNDIEAYVEQRSKQPDHPTR